MIKQGRNQVCFSPGKGRCQAAHNNLEIPVRCYHKTWVSLFTVVHVRSMSGFKEIASSSGLSSSVADCPYSCEVSGLEGFQEMMFKVLRNFVWPRGCFKHGSTYLRSLPGCLVLYYCDSIFQVTILSNTVMSEKIRGLAVIKNWREINIELWEIYY